MEKEAVLFYDADFMLTGVNTDPRSSDFSLTTQEKAVYDRDGALLERHYFMGYDPKSGDFFDLAVSCIYSYSTNDFGEIKRVEDISWFFVNGKVGETRQIIQLSVKI